MADWSRARVIVTGGEGFLGRYLVAQLRSAGCNPFVVSHSKYDLTQPVSIKRMFSDASEIWGRRITGCGPTRDTPPHILFHLAGLCGGIGLNRSSPAALFRQNALMGINLIHSSWSRGVGRFVQVGTVCSYPLETTMPFREDDLWQGYPEPTNAPYAMAKKLLLVQLQAYRDEYGFDGVYVIPTNLYGPGDNFDLHSSHVIPAMIRRFLEARDRGTHRVELWGTGTPTRDFLYVSDCAAGIVVAGERWDSGEPLNLGSGREIQIGLLAGMVANLVGYTGEICFDHKHPDGQPRRFIDASKARLRLGWHPAVDLTEGLRLTIAWYNRHTRMRTVAPGPPRAKTEDAFAGLDEYIRYLKGPSV